MMTLLIIFLVLAIFTAAMGSASYLKNRKKRIATHNMFTTGRVVVDFINEYGEVFANYRETERYTIVDQKKGHVLLKNSKGIIDEYDIDFMLRYYDRIDLRESDNTLVARWEYGKGRII